MLRYSLAIVSAAVGLCSLLNAQTARNITDIDPFTHVAQIPAGSDLSSLTFRGVKAVNIATKIHSLTNQLACDEAAEFRDPGGSLHCSSLRFEETVPAYEVTYAYRGVPLASDEYGGRYFSFSVYFRPDELGQAMQRTILLGKPGRADTAAFFEVKTSRELQARTVIDEKNSKFCEGNYIDGNWTRKDPTCRDQVRSSITTAPADYVSVRVVPRESRQPVAAR